MAILEVCCILIIGFKNTKQEENTLRYIYEVSTAIAANLEWFFYRDTQINPAVGLPFSPFVQRASFGEPNSQKALRYTVAHNKFMFQSCSFKQDMSSLNWHGTKEMHITPISNKFILANVSCTPQQFVTCFFHHPLTITFARTAHQRLKCNIHFIIPLSLPCFRTINKPNSFRVKSTPKPITNIV